MSEHIQLDRKSVEEASRLIQRKNALDSERKYLYETLARVEHMLAAVGREQDAWLASVAGDRGVPLERMKDSIVSVELGRLILASCSKPSL